MKHQPERKSEQALREEIAAICRQMYDRGLIVAGDGNVSCRLGRDRLLITPSGVSKGRVQAEMMVITDLTGRRMAGTYHPSSEIALHLAVYHHRPDVQALVHGHPPIATAFSIAGESLAQCILPEVIVTLGMIPTTRYATPSTPEGAQAIESLIADYDAIILDHHGAIAVGRSLEEAFNRLETVEHTAKITLAARQLGRVRTLNPEQVSKLMAFRERLGLRGGQLDCAPCHVCLPHDGRSADQQANVEPAEPPAHVPESLTESELVGLITSKVVQLLQRA